MAGIVACCLAMIVTTAAWAAQNAGDANAATALVSLSPQGSERATADMGGKIVTWGERSYVVFQESRPEGYMAVIRTLDRKTGQWSPPVTLGKGKDNHARPSITIDSKGFLHVIIAGHWTEMQHMRSVRPGDANEWTKPAPAGVGTYPGLVCGPDGTLYLAARYDQGWLGVNLHIKPPDGKWVHRNLILKKEPQYREYAGYNTCLAWSPDGKTLHAAFDVYEGYGTHVRAGVNQAVVYMASDDGGKTWRHHNGSPIDGPPYPKNLDVLAVSCHPRESNMPTAVLRLAGMVVDSQNRPFVLYTSHEPKPFELHLATPEANVAWRELPLAEAVAAKYPGMEPAADRATVTITADDRIQMVLIVKPAEATRPKERAVAPTAVAADADKTPGGKLVWVETADGGKTFRFLELAPQVESLPWHSPNMERPTGHNPIAAGRNAAIIFTQGLSRYPMKGETIHTVVEWLEPAP